MPMLTDDERHFLRTIYALKHATTEQIHRIVLPSHSRRSVQVKLASLRERRLIDAHLLYPDRGARSPRYYHLLARGAHEIGVARLGSNHYRIEQPAFFQARVVRSELELVARRRGWRLLADEQEMRAALLESLVCLAQAQHGEALPVHSLVPLLPDRLRPDLVLSTPREAIPILIAHPYYGPAFWRQRIARYQRLLPLVRAVGIALTETQHSEAERVLAQAGLMRRLLLIVPAQLSDLEGRIH